MDSMSVPPEHQPLGGEAIQGLYGFEDQTGNSLTGGEAIIPILEVFANKPYRFIGTGFFITEFGVFVTARHVLEISNHNNGVLATWQRIPPNEWFIRRIDQISPHPSFDLAIGVACPALHQKTKETLNDYKVLLTTKIQNVDGPVTTYAYPNTIIDKMKLSFDPDFYDGRIKEHHSNGRDKMMLPGPCYRTDMVIHHGASGGPVFGENERVFGVNSTGFSGTNDFYVSQIEGILSLKVQVNRDCGDEEVTVEQLADEGLVDIDY